MGALPLTVVVSPHLDDAVLSCGQFLAGAPGAVVISCLAGTPPVKDTLTSFDEHCGFTSSGQAISVRRAEDRAAVCLLGCEPVHLDFLDRQYGHAVDMDVLVDALHEAIGDDDKIYGPLGLAHPDHHTVSEAFMRVLARRRQVRAWVYEDLPSRVLWPEEVPDRLGWWEAVGRKPERDEITVGARALKESAIDCYRSQLWALDRPTLLVPERFWRLT